MPTGTGFDESLYASSPPEQLQTELQSEPESSLKPMSYVSEEDIHKLADWLEEIWYTSEKVRSTYTEAEWFEFVETLRQYSAD